MASATPMRRRAGTFAGLQTDLSIEATMPARALHRKRRNVAACRGA
jgi:hypothetical protein